MGSGPSGLPPAAYGLCVKTIKPSSQEFVERDVTGDGIPDALLYTDDAEVLWRGDAGICWRQFAGYTSGQLDYFDQQQKQGVTSGVFHSPMYEMTSVGTPRPVCSRKFNDERKRLGLTISVEPERSSDTCYVSLHGSQRRLLNYPVQAKVGYVIDELRKAPVDSLLKFAVRGLNVGIGTAGEFTLKDGRIVKGIIIQIGFVPFGRAKRNEDGHIQASPLPSGHVNFYVYTSRSKSDGSLVDYSSIRDVKVYKESDPEFKKLADEYRKDHRSIGELLGDLIRNSSNDVAIEL